MRCTGFFLFFQYSAFAFSYTHFPTLESLASYASKVPDVAAQLWIDEHNDLLTYLARMPHPLSTWPDKYQNGNWHLHQQGIKNYGFTNYIFKIPHTNFWVQIGGPKHRIRNIYSYNTHQNSYWYTEIFRHWEFRNNFLLDALEIVPTYQTISRFANYLLLKEAIENLTCNHIRIAPTYLVHIAHFGYLLCDDHYVVVQEHIPNLVRIKDAPDRIHKIGNTALTELFQVICNTGYWNIRNGLYIDQDNNLVLLDYEQRNIENPEDFFCKDRHAFEQCVINGIKELANIHLKPYSQKKYTQLLFLIATDNELPYFHNWRECIELLNAQ